ncbi:MAG: hypothetical protein RBR41_07315 [Desulfovibrio sp.]|uniref:hypothetical protein n=1 Tax=Desulfovibrio sp. TaxID=885 RepID=UPI002A35D796|nr:hypothetical protein [Desulfovibrio sp.]MDY0259461.1 hypothetical protein [Desulfovibrio sp.]
MTSTTPPSQKTIPQFFIIESLTLADEKAERFEGKFLYNYLKILGKNPIYFYIRSKCELEKISSIFREKGYRYLFLSCHGDASSIHTSFDEVKFEEFASIFERKLEHRRLFVSGCSVGQQNFAEALFEKNGGMYSLTAPKNDVRFTQTLPFWSSFFYLMESVDSNSMKGAAIYPSLQLCSNMFDISMTHFFKSPAKGITHKEFISNEVFSEKEMNNILQLERKS